MKRSTFTSSYEHLVREKQRYLAHTLEERFSGEVYFDPFTRALYSTDGSIYQIEPLGVVLPRHDEDLFVLIEAASHAEVPLIPRGAGTSLDGQVLGPGLIVDCSRHLNRIHDLDPDTGVAEVEPGVVCSVLNSRAQAHGLMFGTQPASANRATMGGIIGNNATGVHSVRYGMSADHLLATEVVLSDGSGATFGPLSVSQAVRKSKARSLEGRIIRSALAWKEKYSDAVESDWPRTWRLASGYNLNYLFGFTPNAPANWYARPAPYFSPEDFNLAPLLAGSEGTLALLRRIEVRLVPRPSNTALVILGFDSIVSACDAAPQILEYNPSAIELIPGTIIDRALTIPAYSRKMGWLQKRREAFLVVEFDGFTEQETLAKTSPLNNQNIVLTTPEAQADLWEVRTGGLGLLMSVPGDTKPITFIEDLAVPVEKLGVFVRRVEEILSEYGTHGEWYAHASAGCLHLRPLINLKTRRGVSNMRAIADQVVELVIDLEGALSGEHGDGLARTEFNPRLFGPHLIGAFRDVKRTFDPNNLFNPGKIVWPRGSSAPRMDENLRYGPGYQIEKPQTFFSFHKEGGLARAAESCVGVGICRKDDGLMCPSYQATKEEHNLTRGRANALRMALSGQLPTGALTSQELYEIFDLCLECKGCKAECPTGVDVARLKSEFLALYQAEHGIPLRSRLFAEINILSRWASPIAGLLNNLGSLSLLKSFLERFLGVSSQRQLPALTSHSFRRWFNQRNARVGGEPVLLFVDTYIDHMCPEVGRAAVEVLEAAGFQVMIEPNQGCCGRPMISKGLLARAKSCAENNLKVLAPYAQEGIPIVGVEPSCILTLRDEYLDFFPQDLRARQVARHAYLIEELLTEPNCDGLRPIQRISLQRHEEPWMLHGHCYVKALVGTNPTMDMLRAAEGEVREIPSGCCGMAGSFGYETEHYELSMQIGDMILFPAVRKGLREGAKIIAHGMSCRTQIQDGTGVKAIHPVQALAECLVKETDHPPP